MLLAMSTSKIIQGSGLDDQTENEFYRKFCYELNGVCGKKKLDCIFKRRKDINQLHPKASHLIVRAPLKRTEKLLAALAKGIPVLHEAFIRKVIKDEKWIDPKEFDIGNSLSDKIPKTELHFPHLTLRSMLRNKGGVFNKECVVVLLEDTDCLLYTSDAADE